MLRADELSSWQMTIYHTSNINLKYFNIPRAVARASTIWIKYLIVKCVCVWTVGQSSKRHMKWWKSRKSAAVSLIYYVLLRKHLHNNNSVAYAAPRIDGWSQISAHMLTCCHCGCCYCCLMPYAEPLRHISPLYSSFPIKWHLLSCNVPCASYTHSFT